MGTNLWAAYVCAVVPSGERQEDTGERVGQTQATISRWRSGKAVPDGAASVAAFAQAYGRNVLEAFVAAGFLTDEEAGRGLPASSRRFLAGLREDDGEVYDTIRDTLSRRRPPPPEGEAGRPSRGA